MSPRARGWLAVAVGVALLAGLALLGRGPQEPITTVVPSDTLVAGRPAPPSTSAEEPQSPHSRARAVLDLLDRRATAMRQRDEAAFLATVDPRAAPEFVAAQRALFANLGGLPLSAWSYEVDGATSAQPPARQHDDAPLWAPRTTLRYAFSVADEVPTYRPLGYLYVQRDGGRWYLASDNELGADAEPTWRGPWDFGPCVAVGAASGLVVGHPGQEELMTMLATDVDGAVAAVTAVWGTEWSQRVAVLVPASIEEMRALVGPAFAVDGIAAAAVADRVDAINHTAVGQRVVLNPDQAGRLSASARRIVLRHEITHVAARAFTVTGAPTWLLEGFADYVGYRDSGLAPREAAPDLVRALGESGPPNQLPADSDFDGANEHLDLAYQLAWSAALHVVDRVGEAGLVRLYRQIAGSPTQDQATVDTALRDVLGLDLAGFVASWRDSLGPRFA
jgi:hypothetical protein